MAGKTRRNMNSEDPTIKLILLGNGSVGKSAIISRFTADGFDRVYKQTVGLDFFEKKLVLRGDKRVKLQVWDIGGQSVGSSMLGKYIFGSDVVFLCYDVTDPQSFSDLDDWLRLVRRSFTDAAGAGQRMDNVGLRGVVATAGNNNKKNTTIMDALQIFAVGNKMDLQHLRKVTEYQHAVFLEENNLTGGFFTSAQSGDNVTASFYDAAAKRMGIKLSDHELAFHRKALAVTVMRGGDDGARAPGADAIEAEDLAHGETWQDMLDNKGGSGGCGKCTVS